MVFKWQTGAATRIAVRAALASAATGLLLATFQVQGWTMPKPLAVILIVLLVAMIVVAVAAIVGEAFRAFMSFLEHRATTPSWVASAEPGVLDYEPDGIRANKRFMR
jgi:peptidoglycan/LPS O-acetylase OafA/YrhL